jgi:hypothetical protein
MNFSSGLGLNFASRTWQTQTRNPYFSNVIRSRPSGPRLSEQSSTATLRPQSSQRRLRTQPSRSNVQDASPHPQVQNMRSPPSQINLRSQPSVRRLNPQPSSRGLRPSHESPQARIAGTSAANIVNLNQRLPDDELHRRVEELIRERAENLATNPFMNNAGRRNSQSDSLPSDNPAVRPTSRAATSRTGTAVISPSTTGVDPTPQNHIVGSPHLGRRRSNRNLGHPPGVISHGFPRSRLGYMPGAAAMENQTLSHGRTPQSAPALYTN